MADKKNIHAGHRSRVKKRYADHGVSVFAPHELLELLLFYAIPQKDTNPLAHRLIDEFGSVNAVLHADRDVLSKVEGITPGAVQFLSLLGDTHRYCEQEKQPVGSILRLTDDQIKFLRPRFETMSEESMWMVSLDVLYRVVGVHKLSSGTPTSAQVGARDVLRYALADNAVSVVIAHNHPSGLALPSQSDLDTTVALANTLKGIGVQLLDHLIFAEPNECVSFRQSKLIEPCLRGIPCI